MATKITAQQMVEREVHYCVSWVVHTLAQGYGGAPDLHTLTEQAFELSAPIDDYEEAAREAGWRKSEPDDPCSGGAEFYLSQDFSNHPTACTWQQLCDAEGIEPYQREVFEHWIVSEWLADKLAAKGEKIDKDFAGLTVWGRTTTGQAIYMDAVIEEIHRELIAD